MKTFNRIFRPLFAGRRYCGLLLLLLCQSALASDARSLNALLDGVLAAHVEDGYIDYPEIARNVRFQRYLAALADVDLSTLVEPADQIAFWLNAYNAVAIKIVTEGVTPITRLSRLKYFRRMEHNIAGDKLDLNSIGDRLAEFEEPRVYFAMVAGAYSAPDLPNSAFRGDQLEQQLTRAARQFINDNSKNRISNTLRKAKLSQMFEDQIDAFGGSKRALMSYIAKYIDDKETVDSLEKGYFEIEYLEFEWGINGRPM